MGQRYHRAPGQSPQYTDRDTAFYMSRKARLSRGFALNSTRHLGDRYYFRSGRAPRKDDGEWIVTVGPATNGTLRPDPNAFPGYGEGTPFMAPYSAFDADGTLYAHYTYDQRWTTFGEFFRYSQNVGTYGADNMSQSYGPDGQVRDTWAWIRMSAYYGPYDATLRIGVRPHSSYIYTRSEPTNAVNSSIKERFAGTIRPDSITPCQPTKGDRYVYAGESGMTFSWEDLPTTGDRYWWLPTLGPDGEVQCIYKGPSLRDSPNAPMVGDGAGGGTGPVSCAGGKGYTCTCPDFSREEHPYQSAIAPSQHRHRSWQQSNAGVRNFPCKHIVCAAREEQDWRNILCWTRQAAGDLPARELYHQTITRYNNWVDKELRRRAAAAEARQQRRDREMAERKRQDAAKPKPPQPVIRDTKPYPPTFRTHPYEPPDDRPWGGKVIDAAVDHVTRRFRAQEFERASPAIYDAIGDADLATQYLDNIVGTDPWESYIEPRERFLPPRPKPPVMESDGELNPNFDQEFAEYEATADGDYVSDDIYY